jgi:hypothetical protein
LNDLMAQMKEKEKEKDKDDKKKESQRKKHRAFRSPQSTGGSTEKAAGAGAGSMPNADTVIGGKWVKKLLIGSGFQGRTYTGKSVESGETVAVKELRMRQISAPHVQHVQAAFALLKTLDHPCIVRYLDVVYQKKRLYSVSQLVQGGSLGTIMQEHR